ncbi:MAG TPA: hypothetical protein VF183_14090 [Acidimicrobiales bacterium]
MRRQWCLRALFVLLASVSLVTAACGDDGDGLRTDGDATGDGGTSEDRTGDGTRGGGGGVTADVAIQVSFDGGFVPIDVALSSIPIVTVLRDGTVLTPAPVPAIYPGPAISPVQRTTITPDEVDALLARADQLGLLDGPLDFGLPAVTDLPTTVVTLAGPDGTVRHEAYALEPDGHDEGISETAAENRRALRELVRALQSLPPGDELWTPSQVAVTVIGPYTPDTDIGPQTEIDWPLDNPLQTSGDYPCTVVDGADVDTLLAALSNANQRTPWVVDGARYSLTFRPVLPGTTGCA